MVKNMKNKILKLILNKKIMKLQHQMKKQEKEIKELLDKLDAMDPQGKEVIISK